MVGAVRMAVPHVVRDRSRRSLTEGKPCTRTGRRWGDLPRGGAGRRRRDIRRATPREARKAFTSARAAVNHYGGRSWRGFHHHATSRIAAYGFLVRERGLFPLETASEPE